jgi:hypothetical protein
MIRTLAMIAIAGFFVAVLSLSGAAALGGYDLTKNGWSFPVQWNWDDDDHDRGDSTNIDWKSADTTKDFQWAGDDELAISVPADVTFTQAATPKLVITGPSDAVNHIVVDNGHIGFSGRNHVRVSVNGLNVNVRGMEGFRRLKIEVAAPDVSRIKIGAASNLTIVGIKRTDLEIEANTASHVSGTVDVDRLRLQVHTGGNADLEGRADDLDVEVHTGADARLSRLAVKSARVEANTGADVELAPTEAADVEVHTGADVLLRSNPPQLHKEIHTGGDLRFAPGLAETAPTATNAPAPPAAPAAPKAPKAAAKKT